MTFWHIYSIQTLIVWRGILPKNYFWQIYVVNCLPKKLAHYYYNYFCHAYLHQYHTCLSTARCYITNNSDSNSQPIVNRFVSPLTFEALSLTNFVDWSRKPIFLVLIPYSSFSRISVTFHRSILSIEYCRLL